MNIHVYKYREAAVFLIYNNILITPYLPVHKRKKAYKST